MNYAKPGLPQDASEIGLASLERVFSNGSVGGYADAETEAEDSDNSDYAATVREMIDDAKSFEDSILAPDRDENLHYFYGEYPPPEGEGKSTAVSTDFRDTVMSILPSLIRIFTSSENTVNCKPNHKGQEEMSRQCTDYLNYVFWEDNPGFLIIHDIIKDALRCKTGVVRWETDNDEEVTEQEFSNVTQEQIQLLVSENPSIEVTDMEPDPMMPGVLKSLRVRFTKSKPILRIFSVPLDEFRVSRKAKDVDNAPLIGHDQIVNISDLVKMGYDLEELKEHLGATPDNAAVDRVFRNRGLDEGDVTDKWDIRYGCYFIRIDKDGDGIAELRKISTIGDNHHVISDEVVEYANFAVWCPDPEPHTLVGDTPADLVKDIQEIKTNMLRGSLDSLAQSIWPRTVFNQTITNTDDVLNDEVGAPIRTTGSPSDAVMSITHQFVGQPVFGMFQIMEQLRQSRTGISDASKGVDPRALQSTTLTGVDAIVQGAQERIELCARILAETGMKQLYKGMLREIVKYPNQERTIQLRGKWVNVNPSTFDPTMRVSVNPTLGKGSDMTRLMILQEVKATQTAVMTQFGVENPLCGVQEFRNTLVDILAIANVKNISRYYREIDEETIKKIAATPKEPDAATLLAQSAMEKNRVQMATEISKSNFEDRKLRVDDDFRRDEMIVKGILDAAKIEAQFMVDVNEAEFESENTPIPMAEPQPLPVPEYAQQLMGIANGPRTAIDTQPESQFVGPQAPIRSGSGGAGGGSQGNPQ
jgi:hypothetical protein